MFFGAVLHCCGSFSQGMLLGSHYYWAVRFADLFF
jgi:hypothetical protein